jgi:hypothetical protein
MAASASAGGNAREVLAAARSPALLCVLRERSPRRPGGPAARRGTECGVGGAGGRGRPNGHVIFTGDPSRPAAGRSRRRLPPRCGAVPSLHARPSTPHTAYDCVPCCCKGIAHRSAHEAARGHVMRSTRARLAESRAPQPWHSRDSSHPCSLAQHWPSKGPFSKLCASSHRLVPPATRTSHAPWHPAKCRSAQPPGNVPTRSL